MENVKFYSNKSNAKRAATKTHGTIENMTCIERDGKFRFVPVIVRAKKERRSVVKLSRLIGVTPAGKAILDCVNGKTEEPAPIRPRNTSKGIIVEKNREERFGVKRPSIGGLCRAVWDECDKLMSQGIVPMPASMKVIATEQGWNQNNAIIEMYQWRKFQGFRGRVAPKNLELVIAECKARVEGK